MDALKKAVVLLFQYDRLLEKQNDCIRSEVDAVTELILRYMSEAKVDEKQHPKTMAAMLEVLRSAENRTNNMKSILQEKGTIMDMMSNVYVDLAVDPAATLQ